MRKDECSVPLACIVTDFPGRCRPKAKQADIESLARDIYENGQLHYIQVVRQFGTDNRQIVYGFRRYDAMVLLAAATGDKRFSTIKVQEIVCESLQEYALYLAYGLDVLTDTSIARWKKILPVEITDYIHAALRMLNRAGATVGVSHADREAIAKLYEMTGFVP